jgi:uncharacterized protein (UPF0248 family)
MKVMSRLWMLNTNIPPVTDKDKKLEWNVKGLTMHVKNTFVSTIIKIASDIDGSAVTTVPLKGRDGYFSWKTGSTLGSVIIKFGTSNPNLTAGSNDYGYYFSNNGFVYAIKQGIRSSDTITVIGTKQKIAIEKTGNCIYLRVNGHRIPYHCIVIGKQDI